MAECNEKCADDCSFDYNDDKQKGVCLIKEEYIIEDHIRSSREKCSSDSDKQKIAVNLAGTEEKSVFCENITKPYEENANKEAPTHDSKSIKSNTDDEPPTKKYKQDEKKEKLRGQNKARPPPFKAQRELNLCRLVADQVVDEPEKKCENKNCTYLHDRKEYLKIKPDDIGDECYVFNITGRCPRGIACRMGSKHLTEDGLNIIDKKKVCEYEKKPLSTKNYISKDLQNRLRKRKYNFSVAEKIVKANDPSKKKLHIKNTEQKSIELDTTIEEKGKKETKSDLETVDNLLNNEVEDFTKARIGPVMDTDLIPLRNQEKKKINWKNKILLSPLTTVGNLPFRRICKEYGADITCGEMALAPKILKGAPEEWALVKRHETEDIFGVQLCGNNPGVLTRCAQLLNEEIDVDFVDLNLGCPIDLIYRNGGGSGMLNRLNVLETVVKSVSQVLDIPLSIKTRTGVYVDKPIAHNLMPKFQDWGVSMITVHGRSREQRFTKLADWEYIEKCAQAAQPIPIYGNGDILSYDDYQKIRETYNTVQGVTIGRGALIKPWIFTEIKENKLIDIPSSERLAILKKYAHYGLEHWGSDTRGVETTRRFMLEWISFLHRYIPVGILERPPQRINERPPFYRGRDDMETLMASSNCADWVKISEILLGKVPDGFHFLPKHRANSWK